MGLLDDAIREHLELKRRHGADPDEVARQENEALGETRRAEFARPEGVEPADAPVSDEPEAAAEPEDFPVREFRAEPGAEPDDVAPRDDAPDDDTVPVEDDAPDDRAAPTAEYQVEEEPARREPFDVDADEPAPAAETPPAAEPAAPSHGDDPWLDGERDEVPADEALDHPRESDEDVLEETPDFLQETPEHDRLWFEQRPPRDFDWDK
jgi:hypothetical protein